VSLSTSAVAGWWSLDHVCSRVGFPLGLQAPEEAFTGGCCRLRSLRKEGSGRRGGWGSRLRPASGLAQTSLSCRKWMPEPLWRFIGTGPRTLAAPSRCLVHRGSRPRSASAAGQASPTSVGRHAHHLVGSRTHLKNNCATSTSSATRCRGTFGRCGGGPSATRNRRSLRAARTCSGFRRPLRRSRNSRRSQLDGRHRAPVVGLRALACR
jgi:hypothetical protein